jgi:DNA polymerase-3 subunit epsilon
MIHICLDTETTGLDPKQGHRIIEIAAIEMNNLVKTGKVFHCYLNPRRDVPIESFRIHNISTEFLQDKPFFEHKAQEFLDFIQDSAIVAHNAQFDLRFINAELQLANLPNLGNPIVDTFLLAKKSFPGMPNSLDALCRRFAIDNSKRIAHGALVDTELLCEVFVELMGGSQNNFAFDDKKNQESFLMQNNSDKLRQKSQPKIDRQFFLTDEELEAHRKFILSNFKENIWNYSKE